MIINRKFHLNMKEFSYYTEKCQFLSKLSIRKKVYEDFKFNPDNYDSKSEEKRVREELEEIAHEKYQAHIFQVNKGWEEFENDLYKEFEIENNPKRKILFNKIRIIAEETNSDEDFLIPDIYNLMEEWVELIKD